MYSVTGETAIVYAPPSGNKWAGHMLMFHDDVKQGLVLKKRLVSMIQSRLSFERRFIHEALSDLKPLQGVFIHLLHERSIYIIGGL